ncbi:uncharacterized protein MYCFIDRAFT_213375 [Pseudocercospora fijiensis CIRAD86]|uniref:Uncharacterized protein n=1 Tax=Pseudocercospora fijiensis (strain CIRAD86) TaxID=383855 RepID=N1QBT5_PSEFD|nr:uncharacterized protein MYCFIDRAFT_213375 [Pseudocercospora fijiensis CIRAD86]EME88683.1 hypothetical protein MYCFIDRAFT_213375 [Pseudocercospora fijiensis CIRAD86]
MIRVRRDCLRAARQQWSAQVQVLHQSRSFGRPQGDASQAAESQGDRDRTQPARARFSPLPREAAPKASSEEPAKESTPQQDAKKPSLIEQLFPEESKKYEEKVSREIPRLPLDIGESPQIAPAATPFSREDGKNTLPKRDPDAVKAASRPNTSVLELRNASKNLTEEDFRRLIPQGKHIEGWTLKEGDIQKVIPCRDLETLAHRCIYYILFSSVLSAFTYKAHVQRIHRFAALFTPSNTASPIPAPPGWMVEGIDVQSAIQAFALVPPNQKLELRQLQPPLTPMISSIFNNEGYRPLVKREDRMPYEARLTMEGPQLQPSVIRHIMMDDGKKRGLSWSGGDNFDLKITRWELDMDSVPSEYDRSERAARWVERQELGEDIPDPAASSPTFEAEPKAKEPPRRTPGNVFIIGFHTENAAQSFIAHWHRRPLRRPGASEADAMEEDGDLPPIANLEILW